MSLSEYNKQQKEEAIRRKEEYNKNPHLCKFCNKPILMKENDKYRDVFKKKFCSCICASKYGHIVTPRTGRQVDNFLDKYSNDEIKEIYESSTSILEFSNKLGYSSRILKSQTVVINRLNSIGIDIDSLKKQTKSIKNHTKGEVFDKYSNWQCARSQIQKHARKVYADSDKPKECCVCGYDKHYEVAHIKAVSEFDDEVLVSEINDIDNLIALCPNHHWEYDNTDFDIHNYLYKITA